MSRPAVVERRLGGRIGLVVMGMGLKGGRGGGWGGVGLPVCVGDCAVCAGEVVVLL